jgi:hypothetical protein
MVSTASAPRLIVPRLTVPAAHRAAGDLADLSTVHVSMAARGASDYSGFEVGIVRHHMLDMFARQHIAG